jgi:DNA repair ATPase RecN
MSETIIKSAGEDRTYSVRSNHTTELAKKTRAYAEAYDQWANLRDEIRRLRESADSKEREANDLRKVVDKAKVALNELTAVEAER